MTFRTYLDNIEKQTGVLPDGFVKLATAKGFTKPGTKATEITGLAEGRLQARPRPRDGDRQAAERQSEIVIAAAS